MTPRQFFAHAAGFLPTAMCSVIVVFATAAIGSADTLIILNKSGASASLIDLDSGEEVARVPTREGPHEVAVSPDGSTAVVGNYGGPDGRSLTVIDVASAKVLRTIELGDYSRPHGIEFFDDGERVAVTAEAQKALIVVDINSGEVLQAIDTDQNVSHMVVLSPDEKRAFVANIGSGSITAIDLENGERIANVETGAGAEGIDITPDGKYLWVTNRDADTVSVIDAESLEIVKALESASFPIRAKVTPDGEWVLVSNAKSGDLTVFDAVGMEESRRVDLALEAEETEGRLFGDAFKQSSVPIGILVAPGSERAFVAHANADVVSVLDLRSWKVTGYLRGGEEPDGLGYSTVEVVTTP